MPSYTTSLRLVQPATGEYSGTWGTEVNNGLTALVDASIAGTSSITMTAANFTLTTANGASDQSRAMFLVLGGTPGASFAVIVPSVSKLYFVTNNTGFAQTVRTSGTGISVPNGASMTLRCDGTNVVVAQNYFASMTLGSALPVASGGTGLTSYTSGGVVYASSASALATGSGLVFDGTNLGIGVTPSAWSSIQGGAIQTSGAGAIWSTGVTDVFLSQNTFFNGNYRYVGPNAASAYRQLSGGHQWFTAPSGTAGNTISFTQAMTLDASGNLGIGITSPSYPLHISKTTSVYSAYINNPSTSTSDYNVLLLTGASSGMPAMMVGAGGTAVGNAGLQGVGYVGTQNNTPLVFVTNDTARARITSGGDLLVGTTTLAGAGGISFQSQGTGFADINNNNAGATGYVFSSFRRSSVEIGSITQNGTTAVLYNTTSDYRLKTRIGSIAGHGERIDALSPMEFNWNADGRRARGFFAHEFQAVYPDSVTGTKNAVDEEGRPVYQAMQAASPEVMADVIAELQSLRARVAALEQA